MATMVTYTVVVALDYFNEKSRSVLHWFCEYLEEVAIVVKVNQNVKLL